jgi:putative zinc finger/helix-turn-helix YgiT family protein
MSVEAKTAEQPICQNCGLGKLVCAWKIQRFCYGADPGVMLEAHVPVWSCPACGDQFTDGAAEEIRHEVVCRHLGRLTPKEIRALRESYDLSQDAWANATGVGLASVKRWESGNQIQGEALDNLMRLLAHPENLSRIARGRASDALEPRLRSQLPDSVYVAATQFSLRIH